MVGAGGESPPRELYLEGNKWVKQSSLRHITASPRVHRNRLISSSTLLNQR